MLKKKAAKIQRPANNRFIVSPVRVAAINSWGPSAKTSQKRSHVDLKENGGNSIHRISEKQRVGLEFQRGNVAAVMATTPAQTGFDEIFIPG